MKELNIRNLFIQDISALANMTALDSLSASYCGISDISVLADKQSLRSLFLSGNYIRDISPLQNLHSLEFSELSDMYIYLPVQRVSRPVLSLQNPITGIDGSPVPAVPYTGYHIKSASYTAPIITWNLSPRQSKKLENNAISTFSQEVQIGAATATFSGYVYQPYVYTPLTPGDSSLPVLWGGVIITSGLAALLLIFFKMKLR